MGGSGLYVRAAIDEMEFPGTDPEVRARLEAELEQLGPYALHGRLAALDPAAAEAILTGNGRRIVRALEVIEITGQPFTANLPSNTAVYDAVQIGVAVPRPELDERITLRVDRMWRDGLLDEVRSLEGLGLREGGRPPGRSATSRCWTTSPGPAPRTRRGPRPSGRPSGSPAGRSPGSAGTTGSTGSPGRPAPTRPSCSTARSG